MRASIKIAAVIGVAAASLALVWASLRPAAGPAVQTTVDFGKALQVWDGFGVHYVEVHHSRDYKRFPENYGGLNHINAEQREQVIQLVFGADGLKPSLIKAWADPFHEPVNDNKDPYKMNPAGFDHKTTAQWVRYFCSRGLDETKKRGDELQVIAGLHAPPGWVTKQKIVQGRDLDPAMKLEVAEYLASWAKYLRDDVGLPVKYASPMNEAEDKFRWPEDGGDPVSFWKSENNMWWPDHQVVEFLRDAREVFDRNGLKEVGLTNGETNSWGAFYNFKAKDGSVMEYAPSIRKDPVALKNLGLITSHGFRKSYDPRGVDLIREVRPELHAWTTSYTWGEMNVDFLEDTRNLIYGVKCNGIIPWATVHNDYESDKLTPPATVRVSSNPHSPIKTNNGQVQITKAYYHYKQVTRIGRPKMAVAQVSSNDPEIGLIAFAANRTANPDGLTVINVGKTPKRVSVRVSGTKAQRFGANVTTDVEYGNRDYEQFREFSYRNGTLEYTAPARSSTTFVAMP